ncbi:hypothetical protein DFJ63DRAFT_312181 [Scheffersomyces coipomensis]|uniref:uncharacterized protein n=1 Tax=Scheffersomyces coipomensis TaxID=1788519 RepID=UPI00315CCF44
MSSFDRAHSYAFALAIKGHLSYIENELERQITMGSSDDNIAAKEIRNQIQMVVQFGMDEIISYYKDKELDDKNIKPSQSLLINYEVVLLDSRLDSFDIPTKFFTKDIIKGIENSNWDDRFKHFKREDELTEKFYCILKKVLSINQIYMGDSKFKDNDVLSYLSGLYLTEMLSNASDVTFSATITPVVKILIRFLTVNDGCGINIGQAYKSFVELLKSHLELKVPNLYESEPDYELINRLREQGNNLMNNSAYAQAIKVYTNALDLSRFPVTNSIPQLYLNRAIAFIGLNCFPEAINDLDNAVQLDKSFTPAWTQLGYCHLYMGNGLVALKSYLMALKSAIGELQPEGVTRLDKEELIKYKSIKMRHILPQFIHRLCQSIGLTEKRAYQQNESFTEIKTAVGEVKRILANLRAECLESDRDYFVYYPQLRDSNLRNSADISNRSRPNILTREIAQNMLASGGMETVTVSNAPRRNANATNNTTSNNHTNINNSNNPLGNDQVNGGDSGSNAGVDTTARGLGATPPLEDIRGLLNNFGSIFENAGNANSQSGQTTNRTLGEIIGGALQGGVESMISSMQGGPESRRVFINGREVDASTLNNNTNNTSNNQDPPNSEDTTDHDIQMPDDLD